MHALCFGKGLSRHLLGSHSLKSGAAAAQAGLVEWSRLKYKTPPNIAPLQHLILRWKHVSSYNETRVTGNALGNPTAQNLRTVEQRSQQVCTVPHLQLDSFLLPLAAEIYAKLSRWGAAATSGMLQQARRQAHQSDHCNVTSGKTPRESDKAKRCFCHHYGCNSIRPSTSAGSRVCLSPLQGLVPICSTIIVQQLASEP